MKMAEEGHTNSKNGFSLPPISLSHCVICVVVISKYNGLCDLASLPNVRVAAHYTVFDGRPLQAVGFVDFCRPYSSCFALVTVG